MDMKVIVVAATAILLAGSSGAAFAARNADVWVLKSVRVPANDDTTNESEHASQKECNAAAKQYDKTHPGRKAGCFKK